jgi:peroxiredoxin
LQAYQAFLPELRAAGGALVAISPMLPDNSLSMAEKNALEYEVLSDVGNAVAREYGLVWRLPSDLQDVYENVWNLLLPQYNGDDSWELPIPGTFVIGRDGLVRHVFVDPDYTRRAEPAEILEAVRSA